MPLKRQREKKTNNKINKNKYFKAKTNYLNLKAPSNVMMETDQTLNKQNKFN